MLHHRLVVPHPARVEEADARREARHGEDGDFANPERLCEEATMVSPRKQMQGSKASYLGDP